MKRISIAEQTLRKQQERVGTQMSVIDEEIRKLVVKWEMLQEQRQALREEEATLRMKREVQAKAAMGKGTSI